MFYLAKSCQSFDWGTVAETKILLFAIDMAAIGYSRRAGECRIG